MLTNAERDVKRLMRTEVVRREAIKKGRVAFKEVFIGQHPPTTHYAPAAKRFIPAEELYVTRKQRQR